MRKRLLLGLLLSLGTAGLVGCGDPGDSSAPGDEGSALDDGGVAEEDGGADGTGLFGGPNGSIGSGSAGRAFGAGFDRFGLPLLASERHLFAASSASTTPSIASVSASVAGSGPYTVTLLMTGIVDNDSSGTATSTAVGGVKVAYTKSATAPTAGCTGGSGETVLKVPVGSLTGYTASTSATATSTYAITQLANNTALGDTYSFLVCPYDATTEDTPAGASATVDINGSAAGDGSITDVAIAPRTSLDSGTGIAVYTAYLNLAGFTNGTGTTTTVTVRVGTSDTTTGGQVCVGGTNAGASCTASNTCTGGGTCSSIPVAGCGTAGTYVNPITPTSTADLTGVTPTDYSATLGTGSIAIPGLTIASGATAATYNVRVCGAGATNGATTVINLRTDIAPPANGIIAENSATTDTSGNATIPLTSGWTDDRGIDHVVLRVNTGTTAPAAGCGTAGTYSAGDNSSIAAATAGLSAGTPFSVDPDAIGSVTTVLAASAAGTQYTVRVCAVDVEGNTAAGATVRVTAKSGDAAAPTVPTFTAINPHASAVVQSVLFDRPSTATTTAVATNFYNVPSTTLQIDPILASGATEICISNTALTSLGTTSNIKGPCGTGWKALSGTGEIATALAAGTHPWILSAGDGEKTVYVKTHDAAFNESPVATAYFYLDTIAPRRQGTSAKAPTTATGTIDVSWNRFLESGSGVASYKLVYATGTVYETVLGTIPTDCSASTSVKYIPDWYEHLYNTATATSTTSASSTAPSAAVPFRHTYEYSAAGVAATGTPLTNGTLYVYRVCATDLYGNASTLAVGTSGVTANNWAPGQGAGAVPAANYSLPTWVSGSSFTMQDTGGSVTSTVNSATVEWSNSVFVQATTASLTATSTNTMSEYCFSRSNLAASCTEAMWKTTLAAAGTNINIGGGDGVKTIYVHARDQYRNTTASPSQVSAQIRLDRTPPANPTLNLATSSGAITLTWTAASEAGIGLATQVLGSSSRPYKIVYKKSASSTTSASAPPSCSAAGADVYALEVDTAAEANTRTLIMGTGGSASNDDSALTSGRTYAFRLCVFDKLGNYGSGVTKSAKVP